MTDRTTYRTAVADYFRARPNIWISHRRFLRIGGECAWRTRISECRTQLGMTIAHKTVTLRRRVAGEAEPVIVAQITFRKFIPRANPAVTHVDPDGQIRLDMEAR